MIGARRRIHDLTSGARHTNISYAAYTITTCNAADADRTFTHAAGTARACTIVTGKITTCTANNYGNPREKRRQRGGGVGGNLLNSQERSCAVAR